MAIASHATITSAVSSLGDCSYEIIAPTNIDIWLIELSVVSFSSGAPAAYGFGRPVIKGTRPTTSLFQMDDPAEVAALTSVAVAWGALPTAPLNSVYVRGYISNSTDGWGATWTFPRGFVIPRNGSAAVYSIFNTANTYNISAVIDE